MAMQREKVAEGSPNADTFIKNGESDALLSAAPNSEKF